VKVLLIVPPKTCQRSGSIKSHNVPLGLAYLAATLEKAGHEVKIVDAIVNGIDCVTDIDEEFVQVGDDSLIEKAMKDFNPNLVGISCMFTAFKNDAFRVAEIVKKINRETLVVMGGAHVSANPTEVANQPYVDAAIYGEGEVTIVEIANGKQFQEIKGMAFKSGRSKRGKVIVTEPRELIKNLDDIPFPARHLLDMEKYFSLPKTSYPFSMRYPIIEIVSSRGCPGKCVFCAVHTIWGRCWRARSAKNVVDEVEFCINKYGVKEINFTDDNISLSKGRLVDICKEIIRRGLDIRWQTPNGIAIWTLDKEVLVWMKKSGYYRAKFGLESGSPRTQKYIGKNIDLEHAKKVIRECNKLGIWTASSFIIGFPDETLGDINDSIKFVKSTHLDFARFLVAQPYAGTDLYDDFFEAGLLQETKESSVFYSTYDTKHFKAAQLRALRKSAQRKFLLSRIWLYLNPIYFFSEFIPKISSREKFAYSYRSFFKLVFGSD